MPSTMATTFMPAAKGSARTPLGPKVSFGVDGGPSRVPRVQEPQVEEKNVWNGTKCAWNSLNEQPLKPSSPILAYQKAQVPLLGHFPGKLLRS